MHIFAGNQGELLHFWQMIGKFLIDPGSFFFISLVEIYNILKAKISMKHFNIERAFSNAERFNYTHCYVALRRKVYCSREDVMISRGQVIALDVA